MNNSTSHNMSTSQPQRNDSNGFGDFFNNIQPYPNYHVDNDAQQDEFMWDPASLFPNPQIYSPPVATHTPAWTQNATTQSRDPPLTGYGGLQSSFQLSQYGPHQFDHRQPSPQPGPDPRLVPRPTPSPSPYGNQNPQAGMGFRDAPFPNQHQFNPQTMVYSPRPPQSSVPTFDGPNNRGPFFNYGSHMVNQPQILGMDHSHSLGVFPEQQQRPAAPFIDPSFLTGNAMQRQAPESVQHSYSFLQEEAITPHSAGERTAMSSGASNSQSGNLLDSHPRALMGVFNPAKVEKPGSKARKAKDPNAPKRPRGRPRKDASQSASKQEAGTSTSESDSDELKIVDKPEPTPDSLQGPPPDLPEQRAIYDITLAVWSPRNRVAMAEKVRNGIALFGDVVKKQRDAWKVKNEALKQAELANNADAISDLKLKVAQFRKTIEAIAVQALTFGHPAHLAKLGENPFTMSALQSFLVDRINALDMDGSLVNSILKLMAHFTTLDEEMLDKTKTLKILTRLTKKAGSQVKNLAQSVLDNAAAASKIKAASSVKSEGGDSPKPMVDQKVPMAAGSKRPREVDGGPLPAMKRTVVPSIVKQASKPLALQNAERKKLESTSTKAKTAAPSINGTTSTAQLPVSKLPVMAAVPPKPIPSQFSGLMSASKKPGTSNAARAAAAAKEKAVVAPAPPIKRPSPPPAAVAKPEMAPAPAGKSTFSFMDTLADMTRPKYVEEKKVDDRPPETEEERTRRLRKEERRKLRVSWAAENELTQIKFFVHDPDEEIGHADSAMRDVDDVGGEGRMLKLHKDLEELDDEDDRTAGDEMEPYRAPSEVDFSVIDEAARQIAFMRRGGYEKPESAEKEAQDAREQTTLMVVHALPSDVPPTPKEPPAAGDEDDYSPLTSFGEPDEQTRLREAKYYESQRAPSQSTTPLPDLSAILNLMKQQHPPQPDQQPAYGAFVPQPQPPQQPAQGVDISKILAVMSQLQQPQQQPVAPQPQQQPGAQVNLAALLAQMQGQQQQPPPAHAAQPFPFAYGANLNPYPSGADTDYSREHGRHESNGDYDEAGWKAKKAGVNGGTAASTTVKPHPKAKTVVCKFWQEGKCKKGDDCTFIHET